MKKGLLEQIGRKQEGNAICRLLLAYASRKISKSAPAEGNTCDFSVVSTAALRKTSSYLLDIESRPKEMFSWMVKQTTDYARITEALKAQDKMERVIK